MIVLRVQDAEGRGPYRPGFSHRWSDPEGPIVPLWWEEIGEDMMTAHARMAGPFHYGCGFLNQEQFAAWFSEKEQRRLDRLGFSLVTIPVAIIVAKTPTQIVFGSRRPLADAVGQRWKLGSKAAEAA